MKLWPIPQDQGEDPLSHEALWINGFRQALEELWVEQLPSDFVTVWAFDAYDRMAHQDPAIAAKAWDEQTR